MRSYLGCSELGMCARRVYYAHSPAAQELKDETPEGLRVMAMGNALEEMILREWHKKTYGDAKAPAIKGRQLEVSFGSALGHLDGYIKTGKEVWVLDAKATTSPSMRLWRKDGLPDYYRAQGYSYCKGLQEKLGPKLKIIGTIFIAMDRLSGYLEEFRLPYDEEAATSLLTRTESLARIIENGPCPEREYEISSTQCKWCPWRKSCWGIIQTELEDADKGRVLDAADWVGFEELCQEYKDAQELKGIAAKREEEAKDALVGMLSAHTAYGGSAGGWRVTCPTVNQEKFDQKKFRAAMPDAWAKFRSEVSFPRLQVRRLGE